MRCEAIKKGCQEPATHEVSALGDVTLKLCRAHKDWALAEVPDVMVKRLRRGPMKLYVIEEGQLNVLAKLSKRLYTEQRMNADEMRDGAQALAAIIASCRQVEIPER